MDICDWLRGFLKNGPKEISEVRKAARDAGYTRGELKDARRICLIKVTNNWSPGHPVADRWFWELPEDVK